MGVYHNRHEMRYVVIRGETRRLRHLRLIELHVRLVEHSFSCKDRACPYENCRKLKALLNHKSACELQEHNGCITCRRIWALLKIYNRHRHRVVAKACRGGIIDDVTTKLSTWHMEDLRE